MMRRVFLPSLILLIVLLVPLAASAQTSVVRSVFFYSPTCPHCEKVINQDMPPLTEEYGAQLNVLYVDVTTEVGQALYRSAIQSLGIPQDRLGVPTLVVGEQVLVGSLEIPQQFPAIIEQGLAQGGINWPDIAGLPEVLASIETPEQEQDPTMAQTDSSTVIDRIKRDPLGNGLSIVILIGMIASFGWSVAQWRGGSPRFQTKDWYPTAMILLVVLGAAISGYLAFIETNSVEAVCGPIGDCNTVNSSRFATLFGVLPVGVLGLIGYFLIGLAVVGERMSSGRVAQYARVVLGGLTLIGFLFSLYLTFLEPFVIGATCLWCLSSAVIMTALLLINLGPARASWARIKKG